MAMSPILTDGLRPVGGAWPAGEKPRFRSEGKTEILKFYSTGRDRWSGQGNYFAARALRRQASSVPTSTASSTPMVLMLLTLL